MKTMFKKLLFILLMFPIGLLAQNTLKGIVTDKKLGQPLPGVNIKVGGTNNGTSTDFSGAYTVTNLKKGDIITFKFIGFQNYEFTYDGQEKLNIDMVEESAKLDEIVVIGYGSIKKKDATGSVSTISTKDFNKGQNVTVENLFTGRIAGVNVTSGGSPGAKADIRIRGGSSLNASNEPLIVIDGLPLSNAVPNGGTSLLASINPNDIESFTVLKDASASAIYGSRAANGVIVITMKKGTKDRLKVNLTTQTGYSTVAKKVDVLTADQFRNFVNQNGSAKQKSLLGNANTNWQDEIFTQALTSDTNLALSGLLFKAIPTRLSVGHNYTPGIVKNTNFQRTAISLALNPTFLKNHLKVDFNGNISFGKNQFQDEPRVIGSAIGFDPTQPVFQSGSRYGGYFEWLEANGDVNLLAAKNPVSLLNDNTRKSTSTRKWGNIKFDYKFHFLENLRAVAELGIDKYDSDGFERTSNTNITGYQPKTFSSGQWVNLGDYKTYTDSRQNKNLNAYLNYTKDFKQLKIDLTGGYSYQLFQRVGYASGDLMRPNPAADVTTDPDINLQSFFARANLGYNNRYLLTINYRKDGTSRFAKENRWGNFGGAAFAWNINEESFLRENKTLSTLKLRLGYGTTGQQDITASYDYLKRVSLGTANSNYVFGNTAYQVAKTEGYNKDIKWEETKETNIGLDYGFVNNRITGTVNYFEKKATDLLADVAYPDGANIRNSGFQNIGKVTTKGIEWNINADIVKKQNLTWNLAFNTTYINRKITDLGFTVPSFQGYFTGDNIAGGSNNRVKINTVGFNPESFYVYEQLYDANLKPIQGAYVDRNGDGKIDGNDRYRFHKPSADYTFGLFSNFNYKQFDFSMNWRASLGNYIFDNISSDKGYSAAALRRDTDLANITTDYYNTGFTFEDNGTQRYLSDYFIKDASFIKLDNVTLGYSLNNKLLNYKTTLHFSLGVQNALVLSKFKGLDPEVFSGVSGSLYPRARTYILNVTAGF